MLTFKHETSLVTFGLSKYMIYRTFRAVLLGNKTIIKYPRVNDKRTKTCQELNKR